VTTDAVPTNRPFAVHAVAVTYRRPAVLAETLDAFRHQTRPPDSIVVVDNAADAVVEELVAGADDASYVPMADNGGPAGAIARGMSAVLESAGDDDWVLLIDDDDPPRFPTAVEDVVAVARAAPGNVGAVGVTGARYRRWTGRLLRVPDDELADLTDVDYIGNGMCPLYRVAALRAVGVFDPALFFHFEELDFGLRLRAGGWRLVIDREVTLRTRSVTGRRGLGRRARVARRSAAWRTYYAARNEVLVARRHGALTAPFVVTARLVAGGVVNALRARTVAGARPRVHGVLDGWRGRIGRTVEP
jgi:GT2 family glycosyltransferase